MGDEDVALAAELFEVRAVLEPAVAALAADRAADRAGLRRLFALRDRVAGAEGAEALRAEADVAAALGEASGNAVMAGVVSDVVARLNAVLARAGDWESTIDVGGWDRVLNAVVRGEADEARDAARAHVAAVRRAVLAVLLAEKTDMSNQNL